MNKIKLSARDLCLIIILIVAFALDRAAKMFFINSDKSWIIIKKILTLELHNNSGIAFGIIFNLNIYYILFAIIFIFLIYLLVQYYLANNYFLVVCLSFIIIGAYSNLLDRIRFGAVIDFINVEFWSIFNFADCYIVLSVIAWLIYLFKYDRQKISEKS
ncbi:MAG: signal peptidase II [Patescibacteria group bacterium]